MQSIVFAIASAFLFALTFFLRKQAVKSLSTPTSYLIETIVQFLFVVLIFIFFTSELRRGIQLKGFGAHFAILSGITVTLAVIFNYLALKGGFLTKIVSITSPSQIIFGIILAVILLGESVSAKQILGVIFGIIGIILVAM